MSVMEIAEAMGETVSASIAVMTTHVAGVCEVVRTQSVTPRMRRITFGGDPLKGMMGHWRPEMMLRLYFPMPGSDIPPEPYQDADGVLGFNTPPGHELTPQSAFADDPHTRAYTVRGFRPEVLEMDVDFVLHDEPGVASDWARNAKAGDRLGVVEYLLPPTHRGAADHEADVYLMFCDEAALPALQTNLESFKPGAKVIAFVEVANKEEEQPVRTQADLTLTWLHRNGLKAGTSGLLMKALQELDWPQGNVYVSVSAEIRTVTELRRYIKSQHGLTKGSYKTQAYWRLGTPEQVRIARMSEVTLAEVQNQPELFMESFEDIGMNIEDPALMADPIYEKTK